MIIHGLRHRRDRQGPAEIGSSTRGLSVITIQSGMLVGLGFLAASLLSLLIAPLFWARAVRLTSRRIKESMPVSEIEIRADKDRIRAEYAIKVHKMSEASSKSPKGASFCLLRIDSAYCARNQFLKKDV